MDHNGDSAVDLTDFMLWVEHVSSGKLQTAGQGSNEYWALEEEERLRQLKVYTVFSVFVATIKSTQKWHVSSCKL
jgi:hypothetical protein